MPSTNTLGSDGLKNQSVMGDYVLTVGNDVNTYPATSVNPTGFETTRECMGENSGAFQVNGSLPSYSAINSGAIHRTGNITLFGGNSISLECGAGGIELASSGNVSINAMGGLMTVNAPASAELTAGTLHLAGADGMVMDGAVCQNNCESSSFKGNVEFGTNLNLSGGLSVGGEAFIPHMTSQKQMMTTDPAGQTTGSLNPCQSFAVAAGSSRLAKSKLSPLPDMVLTPPTSAGWIPVNLKVGIPGIPGLPKPLQVEVTAYLQFPQGIRLFSDAAYKNNPATASMFSQATPDLDLDGGSESDMTGPSHTHEYYIPACDLLDSTSAVFAAAKACAQKDPVGAKEMQIGGKPLGEMQRHYTKMVEDRAKEMFVEPIKRQAKAFAGAKAKSLGGK